MTDCVYLDKETGWCKKHSDWSDAMPVIEYCLESPCGDYKPLMEGHMDDLISRSAAIDVLTDALCMTGYQSRGIDAVRFLPAVEAVECVRCKSCVHFTACEEIEGFSWTGFCNYGDFHTDEKDFCSRGVRKEDAHAAD